MLCLEYHYCLITSIIISIIIVVIFNNSMITVIITIIIIIIIIIMLSLILSSPSEISLSKVSYRIFWEQFYFQPLSSEIYLSIRPRELWQPKKL